MHFLKNIHLNRLISTEDWIKSSILSKYFFFFISSSTRKRYRIKAAERSCDFLLTMLATIKSTCTKKIPAIKAVCECCSWS